MLKERQIGFLGAGAITESLIRGVTTSGIVQPDQIIVTNRHNRERLAQLAQRYDVAVTANRLRVVRQADLLIAACKPKDASALFVEVGPQILPDRILLSLMAGVHTTFLERYLHKRVQVVRAMPNTSCRVGESATAIAMGSTAGAEAADLCRVILGAVGQVVEVPEDLMDAVTGLSGSGPAYIYLLLEALVEAGQRVGLPKEIARALALQTLKGAAKMVAETGEEPAVLRQQVTSPNGTTMAGLQALRDGGFCAVIQQAVAAAARRSREMGEELYG